MNLELVARKFSSRDVFFAVVVLLSLVSDGWAGKPSPLLHQLLLLPVTFVFAVSLVVLLRRTDAHWDTGSARLEAVSATKLQQLLSLEIWAVALILAEGHHFRQFGYRVSRVEVALLCGTLAAVSVVVLCGAREISVFLGAMLAYAAGAVLAIHSFPLDYLRSDMLPVIQWADLRLVHHLDPYTTMRVGDRLYDFPYLPGMLVAFFPVVALGLDPRWLTMLCVLLSATALYASVRYEARREAALLLGMFLLCPFLQYRHDLYLQPHWFALVLAVLLMQKGRLRWAALLWGVSCSLYQLSWVMVPFMVIYAFRRLSWKGALQSTVGVGLGFALIAGPFLPFAMHRIASNTVGQWNHMTHALAEPMNFSYWLTYIIRPDQLRWLQAVVLTGLFFGCLLWKRCSTLADTLRWMTVALALFISTNVLVDGYFYLTLLLMILLFLFASDGLWTPAPERGLELQAIQA